MDPDTKQTFYDTKKAINKAKGTIGPDAWKKLRRQAYKDPEGAKKALADTMKPAEPAVAAADTKETARKTASMGPALANKTPEQVDDLATQVQAVKDRRAAAPAGSAASMNLSDPEAQKLATPAVQAPANQAVDVAQAAAVDTKPTPAVQTPPVPSGGSDMTATLTDKRGTSTIGGKRTHMDTGDLADEDVYGPVNETFSRWKKIINHNK